MKQILTDVQERIEPFIAETYSDEGQAEIHDSDSTHVLELWEDGEMTITKNGDLYRNRRLHQVQPPWLPREQVLWEVPEDQEHKRMVVLDGDKVREILQDHADKHNITLR